MVSFYWNYKVDHAFRIFKIKLKNNNNSNKNVILENKGFENKNIFDMGSLKKASLEFFICGVHKMVTPLGIALEGQS